METRTETIAQIAEEFRTLAATSTDGIVAVQGEVIAERIEAAIARELPKKKKAT